MIRIKLLKDYQSHRSGSILVVDNNEAFGLIDSGKAIVSKDMTATDYKSKTLDEEQANGKKKTKLSR